MKKSEGEKVLFGIVAFLLVSSVGRAEPREVVLQSIAMESSSQSSYGQFLVASVIVNRSQLYQKRGISLYKSLELVVLKPKQFSCWNSPKWAFSWLLRHYTPSAKDMASKALLRALNAPKKGITHYHSTSVMPYWAKGHKPVVSEGAHLFYEGIK